MPASVQFPTPLLTPTVYEGNTVVATPVFLRGFTGGVVTVDYTTIDETATAGTDYQATSGVLTFAPGQTSQPIDIPILGSIGDPDNTFQVVLSNPSGAALAIPVQTITFTVANPVTLSSPGVQSNYDGDTVSLPVSASDGLGNPLTFSDVVAGADTLPPGLSIDPNTGIISGTIASNADQGGPYTVTITATDATVGASGSVSFNWNVANPVCLSNPGSQSNYDGDTVSLATSATDALGNPLSYTATGLPAGLSINSSGVITGTIASNADQGGPYSVAITASDSAAGVSASQSFSWYVSVVTVTLVNPGAQANCGGDSVSLALPRSDDANNPLTFAATGLPVGLSIDPSTGEITGAIGSDGPVDWSFVNWTFSVTVTATDSAADVSASQTFSWTVAPILLESPGNEYSFDGDAVDITLQSEMSYSATDALIYSDTGLPSGLSINSDTGEITGTVAANADASSPYTVVLTVTDPSANLSSSQTITWNVSANLATVSLAVTNHHAEDGQSVTIPLLGFDSLSDTLNYSASGLPAGLSVVGNQITGTLPSNADADSPYNITVTATDANDGVSTTQSFKLNVGADLPCICLDNPGDQNYTDGQGVDLALNGSDSADNPLSFTATGLAPGLSLSGNQIIGTISGFAYQASPYLVNVTATDSTTGVSRNEIFPVFCAANAGETDGTASEMALVASPDTFSTFGQAVWLTATVTGNGIVAPTGTVTFLDGTRVLGTVNLVGGQANFLVRRLTVGEHEINARYSGDNKYAGSTGVVRQSVQGGNVTGKVWLDANGNGYLDSGEQYVDATVELYDSDGQLVGTTTPDGDGNYFFLFLDPSEYYYIQVVAPPAAGNNNYTFTFYGGSAANESATNGDGQTAWFQVAAGATLTENAGLINIGAAALSIGTTSGPATVPGGAQYSYLIALNGNVRPSWSVSAAGCQTSQYVAVASNYYAYNPAANVTISSVTISFGNNPVIVTLNAYSGGQLVSVQQICVVKVVVSNPAQGQAFTPGTPTDVPLNANDPQQRANIWINGVPVPIAQMKLVASGNRGNVANPGLGFQATVTLIGPNNNQGVNMIHVGFIQHVQWVSYSGAYGAAGNLVSPLVGQNAIDLMNGAGPWYDQNIGWSNNPQANRLSPTFFSATAGAASATIASFDTPGVTLPASFANNNLQGITYQAAFTLDVAVETTDASNGANLSYWGEARANWTFNGTGNVAANTFTWATPGGGAAPPNAAPNSWATDTPATLMPETYGGATANQLFNEFKFNSP